MSGELFTQEIMPFGTLMSEDDITSTLLAGLGGRYDGQRVLVLIPDHTRSLPLSQLFSATVNILADTAQLDFMVALGTHPALDEAALLRLVGISERERQTRYAHVGLLNHEWYVPDMLASLGVLPAEQIREIAGDVWHPTLGGDVDVRINRRILDYDHIIILGPTFPHEVVGFSGGAKYFFPGISGADMINVTHWLGALATILNTIGVKETPVRAMIHAAAALVPVQTTLVAMTILKGGIAGMFIGDMFSAWSAAADHSSEVHIKWVDKPLHSVLSAPASMYDELWTAAKAMYKLEPAIADGGEVIVYAPHLSTVSHVHGKHIFEAGYHIRDYYLKQWERFKHLPLGVLAHGTHLRGSGTFEGGIERARIRVTLATGIPREDCERLGLGYLDPDSINPNDWRDKEGHLYVPKAGEMLYRVRP